MLTPKPFGLGLALALTLTAALPACGKAADDAPPVPPASDPDGKDLVKGAVVAAAEASGGIRLYKIIHVDDYPPPMGTEFHMTAYDPKGATFAETAKLWKKGGLKIALPNVFVRQVYFIARDHRVLLVEPVTAAEEATYLKERR